MGKIASVNHNKGFESTGSLTICIYCLPSDPLNSESVFYINELFSEEHRKRYNATIPMLIQFSSS